MAKKFYWLKLKDNFFNQREIKKLRKIAGGDTFVIIYLKMQLLSVKTEGKIEFEGTEDSMIDQLELELDEERANIELTMAYLMNNKLLELIDNDYLLPQACENIGKESDSAERVRRHRENKTLQCNTKMLPSNKCNVTSNTEIEIREKKKEKDIEKEPRHKYGEYKNVLLTDKQYDKLIVDFGEDDALYLIKEVDEGVQMKGYKYKDFNLAIRKWAKNDKRIQSKNTNEEWMV